MILDVDRVTSVVRGGVLATLVQPFDIRKAYICRDQVVVSFHPEVKSKDGQERSSVHERIGVRHLYYDCITGCRHVNLASIESRSRRDRVEMDDRVVINKSGRKKLPR